MIEGSIIRRNGTAFMLALVLSVLFVLQATFGAVATSASGPQRDIFGNLLCLSEGGHHDRSADHGSVPACCSGGCLSTAVASSTPPQQGWTVAVRVASKLEHGFAATLGLLTDDAYAHQPRGPPIKT